MLLFTCKNRRLNKCFILILILEIITTVQYVHKIKQNNTTGAQKKYRAIQYTIKISTHTS